MKMEGYLLELGGAHQDGEKTYFRRKHYIKIDKGSEEKINEYIKKLNHTDVYHSIYQYENEDVNNCLIYGPLYLDFDLEIKDENDFKKIKFDTISTIAYLKSYLKIPKELIQVFFSGSKGFHILVDPQILGISPSYNLNDDYKKIAIEIKKNTLYKTVDTSIYDRKRLFRFPNTINSKTGLYKVAITEDDLRRMDFQSILKYASEPKKVEFEKPYFIKSARYEYQKILLKNKLKKARKRKKKIPTERRELLPCAKKLLEIGAKKGTRNNMSVALASSMFQAGISYEEVLNEMLAWNENNEPMLPESEIYSTVRSAFNLVNSGRGYGCKFYKENGLCIGSTCKLFIRSM